MRDSNGFCLTALGGRSWAFTEDTETVPGYHPTGPGKANAPAHGLWPPSWVDLRPGILRASVGVLVLLRARLDYPLPSCPLFSHLRPFACDTDSPGSAVLRPGRPRPWSLAGCAPTRFRDVLAKFPWVC